jgi:hypothetical protein
LKAFKRRECDAKFVRALSGAKKSRRLCFLLGLLLFLQALSAAHLIGSPDEPFTADGAALRGILS